MKTIRYHIDDITKIFTPDMYEWLIETWFIENQRYNMTINFKRDWTNIFLIEKPKGVRKIMINWSWEGLSIAIMDKHDMPFELIAIYFDRDLKDSI